MAYTTGLGYRPTRDKYYWGRNEGCRVMSVFIIRKTFVFFSAMEIGDYYPDPDT